MLKMEKLLFKAEVVETPPFFLGLGVFLLPAGPSSVLAGNCRASSLPAEMVMCPRLPLVVGGRVLHVAGKQRGGRFLGWGWTG